MSRLIYSSKSPEADSGWRGQDKERADLHDPIRGEKKKTTHSSVQPGGGPETPSNPVNRDQKALCSKGASPGISHLL